MSAVAAPVGTGSRALPSGWRWTALSDLGPLTDGDWILNEHYADSGVRLLQVGDVGQGDFRDRSSRYVSEQTARDLNCTLLKPGDILISRMPDPLGRACRLPDLGYPCITAVDVSIWRPDETRADREFLTCYLASSEWLSLAASKASGATRPRISRKVLEALRVPLPPLPEQKRIAAMLREQLDAAARMRTAAQGLSGQLSDLIDTHIRHSLARQGARTSRLAECLLEVKNGVGIDWREYPVLGVTREGAAPGKETVGKYPERYKVVDPGTVFYNPMRILLGSIGMVDTGESTWITSPDYVVVKGVEGQLHFRWFYWWLRSWRGAQFIRSLTRGAVRERMLFRRLASGSVVLPTWEAQVEAAETMRHVTEVKQRVEAQLDVAASLPAALLRRAFSTPHRDETMTLVNGSLEFRLPRHGTAGGARS